MMQRSTAIPTARRARERGVAEVAFAFAVVMMAGIACALTMTSYSAYREQQANAMRTRLKYAAEAVVNRAAADLIANGPDAVGDGRGYARTVSGMHCELVTEYGAQTAGLGSDLIRIVGVASHGGERAAIDLTLRIAPLAVPRAGAFGDAGVTLLNNAIVDSYRSAAGSYDSQATNFHDEHSYARANGSIGSNQSITMDSNAIVLGDATPGPEGAASISEGSYVSGSTAPATETQTLDPVVAPSVASSGTYEVVEGTHTIASGSYHFSSFRVDSNAHLTIVGPAVIVVDQGRLDANAVVDVDTSGGDVTFFATGPFRFRNGARLRPLDDDPAGLSFQVSAVDETIVIDSNAEVIAQVYCPLSDFEMFSNGHLYGSVAARSLLVDGNARIHVDESLFGGSGQVPTVERLAWQVLSSPAAERLGSGTMVFTAAATASPSQN